VEEAAKTITGDFITDLSDITDTLTVAGLGTRKQRRLLVITESNRRSLIQRRLRVITDIAMITDTEEAAGHH
jgi:hypothetical protein